MPKEPQTPTPPILDTHTTNTNKTIEKTHHENQNINKAPPAGVVHKAQLAMQMARTMLMIQNNPDNFIPQWSLPLQPLAKTATDRKMQPNTKLTRCRQTIQKNPNQQKNMPKRLQRTLLTMSNTPKGHPYNTLISMQTTNVQLNQTKTSLTPQQQRRRQRYQNLVNRNLIKTVQGNKRKHHNNNDEQTVKKPKNVTTDQSTHEDVRSQCGPGGLSHGACTHQTSTENINCTGGHKHPN